MGQQLIKITAYVRTDDDLAKWQALPNKTDWLHDMLNTPQTITKQMQGGK